MTDAALATPSPDVPGGNTEPSGPDLTSRTTWRWAAPASLVVLVALGAAIRVHGFTNLDLWFDDAWAAAPARVGWSQAIHMVLTSPGYGLALRLWIRVDPTTTWFLQLPAFVLGLAAIPAVYGLLRFFRAPRWLAVAGAMVATVDPILVQYSTRLKEYPFDLLGACLVLVLAERVRRAPSARRLAALAAATVVVLFVSAGGASVVAGAWLVATMAVVGDRARRRAYATSLVGALLGCVAIWYVFLRHLPSVLNFNWRRRGFLFDYRSLALFERSVTLTFGGFLHGVLAYPVPANFFRQHPGVHDLAVAVLGIVLFCVAIGVPLGASLRHRAVAPSLGAALALLVAVLLAMADRVPLGDGRTDEALYPALFVCLAAGVQLAAPKVRALVAERAPRRAVAGVLAGGLAVGTVAFGVEHPSIYPTISLRELAASVRPLERPGDVVFVDTFNSFAWCFYGLSPCTTKVGGLPPWPQGFRPVSASTSVFVATHYGIPLPEFTAAEAQAKRIWYVGFDYGTFDVGAGGGVSDLPVSTYMTGLLGKDGWHRAVEVPGTKTVVLGVHCYAWLYVRSS